MVGFFGILGLAAAGFAGAFAGAFAAGIGLLPSGLAGAGLVAAGLATAGLGAAFAVGLPCVVGLAASAAGAALGADAAFGAGATGLAADLGLLFAVAGFVAGFAAGFVAAGLAVAVGLMGWATAALGAGLVGLAKTGALGWVAGALVLTTAAATGATAATTATAVSGTGALVNFTLEATGFSMAALTAPGFGVASGSTSVADEPVMRPAATCERALEGSCTGIIGVSTAGFSARPPLTARLLRFERFAAGAGFAAAEAETASVVAAAVVPCAPSGRTTAGIGGWRRSSRRFSGRATGSVAPDSLAASAIGNAAPGSVSDAARAAVSPIAFASALAAFRLLRLRLLREGPAVASGWVASAFSPSRGNSPEVKDGIKTVDSTSATGVVVVAKSAGSGAANKSTRETRPESSRRPPRFTGCVLAMISAFRPSRRVSCAADAMAAASADVSESVVKISSWAASEPISAARRSAFLRAVRLAPPRERRFFFAPASSWSSKAAASAVAAVTRVLAGTEAACGVSTGAVGEAFRSTASKAVV